MCGTVRTWAFDVSDDASRSVVHEFNSNLCDTTSRTCIEILVRTDPSGFHMSLWPWNALRTCSAEDSCDLHQLDGDLSGFHIGELVNMTSAEKVVGTGLGFREGRRLVVGLKVVVANCS